MPPELSEEIHRFEEQYAENPDSLVFARLADLYRKAGEPDRALGVLEEGLERHPDYLSAHIVRARCLRDLGREAEAEEAFGRVLEQDEQNLVALRSLAELARERGEREEARQRYEELLDLDPRNEEARVALEELGGGAAPEPGRPGEPPASPRGEEAGLPGPPEEESPRGPSAGTERGEAPEPAGPEGREAAAGPEETARPTPEQPGVSPEPGEPGEAPEAGDGEPADEEDVPWWRTGEPGTGPAAGELEEVEEPEEAEGPTPDGEEPAERPAAGDDGPADLDAAAREEAEFLGLKEGGGLSEAGAEPEEEGTPDEDIPAGEGLTERIEEITTSGEGDELPEPGEDSEDLLTETLAELYETQGFYREAVEMYEELLEERPDDEELRARLEAARSAMEGEGSEPPPAAESGAEEPAVAEAGGGPAAGPAEEPSDAPEGAERSSADVAGEGPEESDEARAERPATAREHLRALLRGEAGDDGPEPGPPERGP